MPLSERPKGVERNTLTFLFKEKEVNDLKSGVNLWYTSHRTARACREIIPAIGMSRFAVYLDEIDLTQSAAL